ncbi:uncharacterized protein J7T55_005673 [Diaporthe amygdali]|uniref:uncharacterized protein n=1 Tax=Phomopsis amygdali TaxID=1214568 RepID=UPI0022FF2173|nr:uncharacterized protein J7T55_005673 [Diaporthe amygdali]KAJ0124335.1 uncharacterized protein J7T55_005673 [Diaporthe amygdali]
MTTQVALVAGGDGSYQISTEVEVPKPRPGTMLCKVRAVALNPADWKMIDFSASEGAIGGNDFAGEVIEVGQGVERFSKGDRIFGMMFGLNPSDKLSGAFCCYALATEDLSCKIPQSMTFDKASTLGVPVGTAGSALYQALGLPMPGSVGCLNSQLYVLVSGGASATGTIAIQLLKASKDFVLSLGAAETFDYNSSTCGMEIRNYTKNNLKHVLDCVTKDDSMKMCYEAIGSDGGKYVALEPFSTRIQYTRREVQAEWQNTWSLFGGPVKLSGVYGRPGHKHDRKFASVMFPMAERLIIDGQLKPHPVEVRVGGLESIMDGIEILRSGEVKGRKLVYQVA